VSNYYKDCDLCGINRVPHTITRCDSCEAVAKVHKQCEARIAALEARLRNAYVVPPLVWVEGEDNFTGDAFADVIAGPYELRVKTSRSGSRWGVVFDGRVIDRGQADTPDIAKAAAETAYRKHITAGLLPAWGEGE